jgi:beta-glucosidase-like glycosyl hydrolase
MSGRNVIRQCLSAMGATFDPMLVGQVAAKLLADSAKSRRASVIFAPNVNIPRSPVGGRLLMVFWFFGFLKNDDH